MSGVINGDGSPVTDLFGMTMPTGTHAAGTEPPGPRDTDSVETQFTEATGDTWGRVTAVTHGTIEPGQNDDGFAGNPVEDFTSTGAGSGSAGHFKRFSWQAPDGDAA